MSDFKFPCPKCGQNILCDSSNAGMQIPCPVCQTMLTVPPAPPVVPATPGKLSINKTAHHPPPPPAGAANTPAKPVWGAKPAPVKARKKIPVQAIGSLLALAAAGAIAWFMFGAPYFKEQAEKKQQAEELARQQAEAAQKAAEEAAKPKPPKAVWKLDLATTPIPDRPAAGKLHGVDFKAEMVLFQNNFLTLRQDTGLSRQFVISVPLKSGDTLPGKTYEIASTNTVAQPRVTLNWKEDGKPPGAQNFTKGYAMKLEFDAATPEGNIPGKIYLSVPDTEQSFVAGNFEIAPKKPTGANASVPASSPGEPGKRRKKE